MLQLIIEEFRVEITTHHSKTVWIVDGSKIVHQRLNNYTRFSKTALLEVGTWSWKILQHTKGECMLQK